MGDWVRKLNSLIRPRLWPIADNTHPLEPCPGLLGPVTKITDDHIFSADWPRIPPNFPTQDTVLRGKDVLLGMSEGSFLAYLSLLVTVFVFVDCIYPYW